MLKSISIKAKLLSIVISSIILVSSAMIIQSIISLQDTSDIIIEKFKENSYKSKEEELKNYVALAVHTIESYHERKTGEEIKELKREALLNISKMRYGKKNNGYFWIQDSKPNMVMHPIKPSLDGKDLSNIKDKVGKYLFNEMSETANKYAAGGLVKYMWNKPGKVDPQPKFSYVQRFEEWDWIIGTGVYVDDIEEKIIQMRESTSKQIEETIIKNILIILVIMIILAFIMSIISNKIIFNPLTNFQDGLLNFFKYINKENKDIQPLDDSSNDEIGTMAKIINENVVKTKSLIEQDEALINDVKRVVGEVNHGHLTSKVEKSTQNHALQELKLIFNEMLQTIEKNVDGDINKITKVLEEYKNLDFRHKIDNPTGNIAKRLNDLSDIINNLLLSNLKNGSTLEENAVELSNNVEQLSTSSNEQAASLEETAAALEEITSTIINTTDNISQMASYSNDLQKSIQSGQNLADTTVNAMDEINTQTQAIADAITVIDKIAFQTNILSLNAAVEAATAGEAGKGFAVVAQEVRNLASRSAEAAKEIKDLVENATSKTNAGKESADKMIDGYKELNVSIQKTTDTIMDIERASKEQQAGIEQINDAVTELDQITQQNAAVATQSSEIANSTSQMAKTIVDEANKAEFKGKGSISSNQNREDSKQQYSPKVETNRIVPAQRIVKSSTRNQVISAEKSNDNEWESF